MTARARLGRGAGGRRPGARLGVKLGAALVGALLAVLVLEAGVRIFLPQDLDYFNWQKVKRPSARPGWTWELIPRARNDSYTGVPVAVNSLGLRDGEVTVPKPPGTVRILGVGDSVAFGYGVRLEETFLKVLEARLNAAAPRGRRWEVVNGGIEGTDLGNYYAFIRDEAPRLDPDLVLIAFVLNDIAVYDAGAAVPAKVGRRSPGATTLGLVRSLNAALLLNSQLYLASYTSFKSLLYSTGVLDITRVHDYDYMPLEPPSKRQARAWATTLDMLERLVVLTRERGWPLVLAVFPMEMQLSPAALDLYQRQYGMVLGPGVVEGQAQGRLRQFAAGHDVPVVDLLPVFRAAGDEPLFFRNKAVSFDPVHPSPRGHRVAGEAIHETLRATTLPRLLRTAGGAPRAPQTQPAAPRPGHAGATRALQ